MRPYNYLLIALFLAACDGDMPAQGGPDAGGADLPAGTADLRMGTPDLGPTCTGGACVCDPGYVYQGGGCVVAPIGDVAARAQAEVCAAWKQGRVVNDSNPWQAGTDTCDPGVLSRASVDDVMRRINLYRWLVGLYPAKDDAAVSAKDQQCALMLARNGMLNHTPPTTWKCYTADGAAAAASSNEANGATNPGAIELYISDSGTPSLGHRRWVLNPPLDRVGVGYVPSWQCLGVFNGGNQPPPSKWQAVPNPGFTPLLFAQHASWSIHSQTIDLSKASVTVVRKSDGMTLPTTTQQLPAGYGVNAIAVVRGNWTVQADVTYTVTVSGTSTPITYDVKPVNCP